MAYSCQPSTMICTLLMLDLLQLNGKCIRIGRWREVRQHELKGRVNKLLHGALPATQKQHVSLCNKESCIFQSQKVVAQEKSFSFEVEFKCVMIL